MSFVPFGLPYMSKACQACQKVGWTYEEIIDLLESMSCSSIRGIHLFSLWATVSGPHKERTTMKPSVQSLLIRALF